VRLERRRYTKKDPPNFRIETKSDSVVNILAFTRGNQDIEVGKWKFVDKGFIFSVAWVFVSKKVVKPETSKAIAELISNLGIGELEVNEKGQFNYLSLDLKENHFKTLQAQVKEQEEQLKALRTEFSNLKIDVMKRGGRS
jgi:hypothetical protein